MDMQMMDNGMAVANKAQYLAKIRLHCIPMGWTNAVEVFHGHVQSIPQDEADTATPFIDEVPILGPKSRYELDNDLFETIPQNCSIRRFVWEHFQDDNRVEHRIEHAGAMFSGKKLYIGVPQLKILGHICTYDGRIPDEAKTSKILEWPPCQNVSEVRVFLGTCGVVRIFIERFAEISHPLVNLTKKDAPFIWEEEHQYAMDILKKKITTAPVLVPLDYASNCLVTVAVDSSNVVVGWILFQDDAQGRQRPSRYRSIAWNNCESRYSQAKLELYSAYRALRVLRLYLISLPSFNLEVDAKYIKGMINNPDIQPNNVMNRWIAAILLFPFNLVHIAGKDHAGPDGLSRRRFVEDDDVDR